ncbi:MAG TPA: hypothetical protein VG496_12830 [Myxococcales bacterium]|nr:hypothetical protein [Myxococcales bacterium]
MPTGLRRKLTCLLFGLSGLALGVIGAETTFGRLRADASAALLFSVEVRDEAGALLASPMLVGEEGRKVHLDLSQPIGPHSDPVEMSLDLSPHSNGSGELCVEYSLSLDGSRPRLGWMSVTMGEPRTVRVPGPGEPLRLGLVVARAGTREFERILLARRLGKPIT